MRIAGCQVRVGKAALRQNMGAGVTDKIGILLINLGTPEATDFWSMRRYLKEFLSDKRVVEARGLAWWLVLNGIILTRRPKKSGRAYDKIWNRALNESPLKTITRGQAEGLAGHFSDRPEVAVDWAMRYGKPSIAGGIDRLHSQGCTRILAFPVYPQYSGATTATAMDKVFDALKNLRHQPNLRAVPPYYNHPAYIAAIAGTIRQRQAGLATKPDVILASFHGLPVEFINKGDPYQAQCEETANMLRHALGMNEERLKLAYQSRTGRAEWIGPDTEETLAELARNGVGNVTVVAPGFAADCIETLEEIEMRAAAVFHQNGGREFTYVPCLNDGDEAVNLLAELANSAMQGWG